MMMNRKLNNLLSRTAFAVFFITALGTQASAQSRIFLKETTLMHEMRATPSPLDGETVDDRKVSFQWPLPDAFNNSIVPFDGFEETSKLDKASLLYKVRYSQDPDFHNGTITRETRWPMFNPDNDLAAGKWYWQYGYVIGGQVKWSERLQFTVGDNGRKFCPPSFDKVVAGLPTDHPRIWMTQKDWEQFMQRSSTKKEYKWYIDKAEKVLKTKMKGLDDINTSKLSELKNAVQRKAYLTRESRRIIDVEEANCYALVYAYLLTKDERYAKEALKRVLTMVDWNKSEKVKGDFNDTALLSTCTMAYDSFFNILSAEERASLLGAIREKAGSLYRQYNNHLENHIADNHVWQMTLRILTMASFATYNEIPEAALWANYCYNVWVARMPGLNKDGAWHNGDSYFTVNTRTLIEVPYFYSRLSGFDFFQDPWYKNNIQYAIFQQPPFSKSGGNGSSHQKVLQPNAIRVGYLDALARITGDTYAADFVRRTLAEQPGYLKKAFLAKPGDLSWLRLQYAKPLPKGKGLADLPLGRVFPESGLASFMTDWNDYHDNAMWSFRSSPYGSTSHAIANQNAFNTFYGGKSLFYSSGHHTSFVDRHAIYCHRATRAHNTILVNGMGQRIGTEGYGWIPRYYVGKNISYVLGDASNAYGEIISPLWKKRFEQADIEGSPKTGWDKNHLKTYRRHMIDLGNSGLMFIYDELEADEPVTWNYLLHTVIQPMTTRQEGKAVHVEATNGVGISDAYIFSSSKLKTEMTDQFFYPATNWLKSDDKGNFTPNPNHWHFTATSEKSQNYHFATIIDTHAKDAAVRKPVMKNGKIKVGDWTIEVELKANGKGFFHAVNGRTKAEIIYKGEGTIIKDGGKELNLTDKLPKLEI